MNRTAGSRRSKTQPVAVADSPLFGQAESMGFGEIHLYAAPELDLRAIIAIHSTRRGPALGGCRCISYDSEQAALTDAMQLARAMSYKAAITGLGLGGGKAVLMRPEKIPDHEAYFRSFGRFVHSLNGRYIVAEDSGTGPKEMDFIALETPHVRGTSSGSGDPSPYTALGVFRGIQAAVAHQLGRDSLQRLHILIQGAGHVGYHLTRLLFQQGVRLSICDIDPHAARRIVDEFGADLVPPERLFEVPCDLFAPCALGGVIDHRSLQQLDCPIIAGSANNQLADPTMDRLLHEHGILYAPDYVINAGGLIRVTLTEADQVDEHIARIPRTLTRIFQLSRSEGLPTGQIADRLAEEQLTGESASPGRKAPERPHPLSRSFDG